MFVLFLLLLFFLFVLLLLVARHICELGERGKGAAAEPNTGNEDGIPRPAPRPAVPRLTPRGTGPLTVSHNAPTGPNPARAVVGVAGCGGCGRDACGVVQRRPVGVQQAPWELCTCAAAAPAASRAGARKEWPGLCAFAGGTLCPADRSSS